MKLILISTLCIFSTLTYAMPTDGNQQISADEITKMLEGIPDNRNKIKTLIRLLAARGYQAEMLRRGLSDMRLQMKFYKGWKMNAWYRQFIEQAEFTFPEEIDEDFDTKKVTFNKSLFGTKVGYDLQEEQRRQKWLYYARNPPSDLIKRIVARAKNDGITEETLAYGIAHAYRRISEKVPIGVLDFNSLMSDPLSYLTTRSVVMSLRILLQESDVMEEYLPEIPPKKKRNKKKTMH